MMKHVHETVPNYNRRLQNDGKKFERKQFII